MSRFKSHGRHAADPIGSTPPPEAVHPVTREAVVADREARAELTELGAQPTVLIPYLAVPEPAPNPGIQGYRLTRLPVAAVQARLPRVRYPACSGSPEGYAAVMEVISALTGTHSKWEQAAAWPRHEIETEVPA